MNGLGTKPKHFNNPEVFLQGWYFIAPSRKVKPLKPFSVERFGHKLVVFRDSNKRVHVLEGRCKHLGTDLGVAHVKRDRLVCPFHGWEYETSGKLSVVPQMEKPPPKRCLFSFPVEEKFNAVFIYNGIKPLFPLPELPDPGQKWIASVQKGHTIKVHPHIATVNGFDLSHFQHVHGFEFDESQRVEVLDEYRMKTVWSLPLQNRLIDGFLKAILGEPQVNMEFISVAGNQSYALHKSRWWHVMILFNNYEVSKTSSVTTTIILGKKRYGWWRWIGGNFIMMWYLKTSLNYFLKQDVKNIFDHLEFTPGFIPKDEPIIQFRALMEKIPAFDFTQRPQGSGGPEGEGSVVS